MSLKLFQFCLNPVPLLSLVLSFYGNIQWRWRCSDFSSDWRFTPLYTLSRRLVSRKTLNVFFSKIHFHKNRVFNPVQPQIMQCNGCIVSQSQGYNSFDVSSGGGHPGCLGVKKGERILVRFEVDSATWILRNYPSCSMAGHGSIHNQCRRASWCLIVHCIMDMLFRAVQCIQWTMSDLKIAWHDMKVCALQHSRFFRGPSWAECWDAEWMGAA